MRIPKNFTSIQNTTNTYSLTENIQNCQDEENIICDYNDSLLDPIQAPMVSVLDNTTADYSMCDDHVPFSDIPMTTMYILLILAWLLLVYIIYDIYKKNKRCRELTRELEAQLATRELEVQLATVEIEAQSDTME